MLSGRRSAATSVLYHILYVYDFRTTPRHAHTDVLFVPLAMVLVAPMARDTLLHMVLEGGSGRGLCLYAESYSLSPWGYVRG